MFDGEIVKNKFPLKKILDTIHGLRQICLGFPVLFLFVSDFTMLIITKLSM